MAGKVGAFFKGMGEGFMNSITGKGETMQSNIAGMKNNAQQIKELTKKKQEQQQALQSGDPEQIKQANNAVTDAKEQAQQPEQKPAEQKPAEQKPQKQGDTMVQRQIRAGRLSDSFYRDLTAGLKGQPGGNQNDVNAKTSAALSADYQTRAGQRSMEAQSHQQIADQNVYGEADKQAMMQNDSENRQNVRKAGVLGAGAALARSSNSPDVNTAKARSDQQRVQAEAQREKANTAQEEATGEAGEVEKYQLKSRDMDADLNESARLSEGEGAPAEPEQPAQQPEEPAQQPEEEPVTPEKFSANWQNVMNYMTYGNDPDSGWNPQSSKDPKPGRDEAKAFVEAKGWQPLTENEVGGPEGFNKSTGELQKIMQSVRTPFMEEWSTGSGRVSKEGQINKGDEGYDAAAQTNTEEVEKNPPSDARIKDLKECLCDARMKWIKEDWDRDGRCSREDFDWLLSRLGNKFNYNDHEYDNQVDEGWDNDVLQAYADHIRNYVYTYKPEATQIDSRIDPNQEHIGPMAQDIEQVNPACVKETPEGVKTVDTARLAMMNAGAIGDLARELRELSKRLEALGV